jgi:hypothetical protein
MVDFQTKNPNLGKFWKVLQWKILVFYGYFVYFTVKWYILRPFGTLCGHLVYFSRLGKLYLDKSSNPAAGVQNLLRKTDVQLLIRWMRG